MSNYTFTAKIREDKGTSASRRLRLANGVPAIIYGNKLPAISITLEHNKVYNASEHNDFYTSEIVIDIEGTKETVKIQALQRHVYKPTLQHIDFKRV